MLAKTYLLLLESGAGGHFAGRAAATQFAIGHVESGWLLRCRREGASFDDRAALVEVVETFGSPASDALLIALQVAGERHGIAYSLFHTARPTPPFSLPAKLPSLQC